MKHIIIIAALCLTSIQLLSCVENHGNETQFISRENSDNNISEDTLSEESRLPPKVVKLMESYPGFVIGYEDNEIIFRDSSRLIFDDKVEKNDSLLLNAPDIEDMFTYSYSCTKDNFDSIPSGDPGRIRSEAFFAKIYGASKEEVMSNLVEVEWCPKLVGRTLRVNKNNGVAERFKALSDELDQHPEFIDYITKIGGTFNYRKISGTERLSTHAYGITMDINVSKSNYWQWDCKCKNEDGVRGYRNKIPYELVKIFEKHGFIWGGRWRHYDTMHFEYRPELL